MDRDDFGSWNQENDLPFRIQALYDLGYTPSYISRKLNFPKYSVNAYLPDRKAAYGPRRDKNHDNLVLKLHLELVGDFYAGADEDFNMNEEDLRDLFVLGKAQNGFSRDILAPGDMNLHALHYAIQKLFGWQNSHLHHFALPTDIFDELTEDNVGIYTNFCGTLFRFPDDDYDDQYWDEDYEDGMSFGSWLKKKYRRPYRAGSVGESYVGNDWAAEEFFHEFPDASFEDSFESLSDKIVFEQDFNYVIERLTVGEFFLPASRQEKDLKKWKKDTELKIDDLAATLDVAEVNLESLRDDLDQLSESRLDPSDKKEIRHWENRCKKSLEDWNVTLEPFFPELYYLYDYGDGWCIKITVTKREYNQLAYEAMNGNPVCVQADGLNLVDDCGGPYGYLDLLRSISGDDLEEAEETREWARSMGWSGRISAPEKML